ncbi:MAG: hypothetical protein KGJ60_04320 [Verrucomicrobiota bacterium]|nr:hypothetical protein [Verrucomicrobiota bacterium]
MKLRYGAAIVIFVSSYAPLAVMLAIFDFNFSKWRPNDPTATWMTLGVGVISVMVLAVVMRSLHGDYVVQVTSVRDRSNELLNYALPYVASFYSGGGLGNPNFVVALGFFLFVIGWISIRTQIVLINPLLACVGYGLYEISYKDGQNTYERIVLSRTAPETGQALKISALTRFFIFGERAFNP